MSLDRHRLIQIVHHASTLAERLGAAVPPPGPSHSDLDQARIARRKALIAEGDGERFQRRLVWDGLDLDAVSGALGPPMSSSEAGLPAWAELLAAAVTRVRADGA